MFARVALASAPVLMAGLLLTGAATLPPVIAGAPPAGLGLNPFYTRYLDAAGLPVVSSSRAPEEALTNAAAIVRQMLAQRPDIAAELARQGYRIAVMAPDEATTDLPEQASWTRPKPDDPRLTRCERKHYDERIGSLTDRQYWNWRARGLAGKLTSAGTENLLGLTGDRYRGQNIFVHEFSHDIFRAAYVADRSLYNRVFAAYDAATKAGRWKGEYASTTVEEYWAVGTQFWFNAAPYASFGDVHILSDEDLARYDPPLAAVLREAYGDNHRLDADRWYRSPLRVPPGPLPAYTAEVC